MTGTRMRVAGQRPLSAFKRVRQHGAPVIRIRGQPVGRSPTGGPVNRTPPAAKGSASRAVAGREWGMEALGRKQEGSAYGES